MEMRHHEAITATTATQAETDTGTGVFDVLEDEDGFHVFDGGAGLIVATLPTLDAAREAAADKADAFDIARLIAKGWRAQVVRNGWTVVRSPGGWESGKMNDAPRAWAKALEHLEWQRQRDRIAERKAATLNGPGELLTMGDGARWFHPYTGAAPVRITPENEADLSV